MKHQHSRVRRVTTLIAAGALSAGLLGIGSTATASASTPPHASAHQATIQNLDSPGWLLSLGGTAVEYLSQVGGVNLTDRQVTFTRGSTTHSLVDTWLMPGSWFRPTFISIDVLDYLGNRVQRYTFMGPRPTKVVESPAGDHQTITVTFDKMTVSR